MLGEATYHPTSNNAERNTRHAELNYPEDYGIRNITHMTTSSIMSNMIPQRRPSISVSKPAHSAP